MSPFIVGPVETHRRPSSATMASLRTRPTVPTGQIWPHLTDEQRQQVLRTVVAACRSLLNPPPTDGDAGGCNEQP
jgi:hypothetical protein